MRRQVRRENVARVTRKFGVLGQYLDERQRRIWAAVEATSLGWGGITVVSEATGLSQTTIHEGIQELRAGASARPAPSVRRAGGGRKRLEQMDPLLLTALQALVDPVTRGDPESPLLWTCKSLRELSRELSAQGHSACPHKVGDLLADLGYSLQAPQKTLEGKGHPDRDAQFRFIARRVARMHQRGQPVISVDTKKKELIGDFQQGGREWQPKGKPVPVNVYDFVDKTKGKAIPYGVYDLAANRGWVSVGTDHDTATFAVETIRRWWRIMGCHRYPRARQLLITADGGGSNASRNRAWKRELQKFADETGLRIDVCHFPPATSKWNKIEHRMFSHITQNWRGRPLVSHQTVVNLIANTTTGTGLKINAKLDSGQYPLGVKVTDAEMSTLRLTKSAFHGNWNYTLAPRHVS